MVTFERRKYPRKQVHFFAVSRRELEKKEAAPAHVGYVRNISSIGLLFYTGDKLERGDVVSLAIYPGSNSESQTSLAKLEVNGEVLRVESAHNYSLSDHSSVAVQFAQKPNVFL